MDSEALKGHLDSILLAALEHRPLHGYAVMEALRSRSEATVDLPSGTVYPALHRLERAGLVRGEWSIVAGRRRRTYRLTAAGRRRLREERVSWGRFASVMTSLLGETGAPSTS